MSSDHDTYCYYCDVFGHEEGSEDCEKHWTYVELPYRERMEAMIGSVRKLSDPAPFLFDEAQVRYNPPPGMFVRLIAYRRESPGSRGGDTWTIQTLDGKLSATQIHHDELDELGALDRMALLEEEPDQAMG